MRGQQAQDFDRDMYSDEEQDFVATEEQQVYNRNNKANGSLTMIPE